MVAPGDAIIRTTFDTAGSTGYDSLYCALSSEQYNESLVGMALAVWGVYLARK